MWNDIRRLLSELAVTLAAWLRPLENQEDRDFMAGILAIAEGQEAHLRGGSDDD